MSLFKVAFAGLPGAGKSTVARALAAFLSCTMKVPTKVIEEPQFDHPLFRIFGKQSGAKELGTLKKIKVAFKVENMIIEQRAELYRRAVQEYRGVEDGVLLFTRSPDEDRCFFHKLLEGGDLGIRSVQKLERRLRELQAENGSFDLLIGIQVTLEAVRQRIAQRAREHDDREWELKAYKPPHLERYLELYNKYLFEASFEELKAPLLIIDTSEVELLSDLDIGLEKIVVEISRFRNLPKGAPPPFQKKVIRLADHPIAKRFIPRALVPGPRLLV